jgi:hypothetical protein
MVLELGGMGLYGFKKFKGLEGRWWRLDGGG